MGKLAEQLAPTDPTPRKKRTQAPEVRVVSVSMSDGSDINSPEARARIARALLSVPSKPAPVVTVTRQRCDERRASLNRLIEKYGNPTPNAAEHVVDVERQIEALARAAAASIMKEDER
ncbi:hypothetical protein [Deinococcus aestuarii]|uniref:hypothetical protein n=1 Tax=Deinococcus aestuarii TaxID=2774531 RepID=UPI001C0E6A0D|nr:hypothetical protein [Deinococcus aestuarii]